MFEAAGLLAPPSPAQVGLNCHKPLFVEKNSNVTVTRNSDVNLFYLIYIYIFQFYLGFNLLLSLFIIQCVAVYFLTYLFNEKVLARNYLYKKHYVSRCRLNWTIDWQILFLRTIMWHLFYFLILIYFSVLTTVGKSQRQIIMVSQ